MCVPPPSSPAVVASASRDTEWASFGWRAEVCGVGREGRTRWGWKKDGEGVSTRRVACTPPREAIELVRNEGPGSRLGQLSRTGERRSGAAGTSYYEARVGGARRARGQRCCSIHQIVNLAKSRRKGRVRPDRRSKSKIQPVDALDKSEPTKKAKRAPKQSEAERKQVLESNLAISVVQSHRVKCGGCNQWIQLHGEQTYKADNWDRHEKKCSNITGVRRIRTVIKQSSLRPIVQHVMVRQRILLSSSFKEKRERKASLGYVLDFDASPLTPEDLKPAHISVSDVEINSLVELAFQEAALICTQLLHIPAPTPTDRKSVKLTPLGAPARKPKASQDDSEDDSDPDVDDDEEEAEEAGGAGAAIQEAASIPAAELAVFVPPTPPPPPPPHSTALPPPIAPPVKSEFIINGKLSIPMMVQAQLHWQSGTTTKSEKVVRIDYVLSRIARATGLQNDDDTEPEEMTLQEASNAVRVLQDLNSSAQANRPRKYRELQWKNAATAIQKLGNSSGKSLSFNCLLPNISAKNVHALNPLSAGSYTIMWNGNRFYIGEILDVYKNGASSRYGSVRNPMTASSLAYISVRVYLALTAARAYFGSLGEESDDEDDRDPADIDAPVFSCRHRIFQIYTHAKIDHLPFNLGSDAFERGHQAGGPRTLTAPAALRWTTFTKPGPVAREVKKLTLKLKKGTNK
ncbi:hypothetical protein DFH09DRAFT_1082757 [Mycena vulgaris]|nr:hypothetical protein DFH09DRAFT_1082757 [Mycena vulgaris]